MSRTLAISLTFLLLLAPALADEFTDEPDGLPIPKFGCCCTLQDDSPVGNLQSDFACTEGRGTFYEASVIGYRGNSLNLPLTNPTYIDACSTQCEENPPDRPERPDPVGTHTLSGIITDEEDNLLSDVLVYLGGEGSYYTAISNAVGEYSVPAVPATTALVVTAVHPDCQTFEKTINFTEDTTQHVDMTCELITCEQPPPEFGDAIDHVRGSHSLIINYTLPETGSCPVPNWLILTRCKMPEEECYDLTLSANEAGSYEFEDSGLLAETTYNYQLTSYYGITAVERTDNPISITTGHEFCMSNTFEDEFCLDNDVQWCDDENILHLEEDCESINAGATDYTCRVTLEGATCVEQLNCAACNAFLSSFPDHYDAIFPIGQFTCNEINTDQTCVLEALTPTSIDGYGGCFEKESCFDYHSQDSCEDDPCQKFTSCTWEETPPYLGGGVCVPEGTGLQCEACDALGAECTAATCQVLGDNCYFKTEARGVSTSVLEEQGVKGCVDEENFGCRYYDDKKDCVNATGNQNASAVLLDSMTNEIIVPSDDHFGYGTCIWSEEKNYCVKDANGDKDPDGITLDTVNFGSYQKDNEPPVTTLLVKERPWYTLTELREELQYVVSDNSAPSNRVTTYFCLTIPGGEGCYPRQALNNLEPEGDQGPGEYILYYYSADPADNLEVRKATTVLLQDTTVPEVLDVTIL